MTDALTVSCQNSDRRARAHRAQLTGIDFVDYVRSPGPQLVVHLFGAVPEELTAHSFVIEGGRRVPRVQVLSLTVYPESRRLLLELACEGDASTYTVRMVGVHGGLPEGVDPRYTHATFSFKLDCPSELDCADACGCDDASEVPAAPLLDYLAKDYASFRQLLLERLSLTLPAWRERHVPDLGIALVELMAYVGDHLSYRQDAIATEAYLNTARLRTSVRRHARLVDYPMHEGCSARTWVVLCSDQDLTLSLSDVSFVTRVPSLPVGLVDATALAHAGEAHQTFVPIDEPRVRAALGRMRIYTWGGEECYLPRGATEATLLVPGTHERAPLAPGEFLLLEEVLGPRTGLPEHADPAHRHVVRLSRVTPVVDPLRSAQDAGTLYDVAWDRADALPFALTLSTLDPNRGCASIDDVSVARGNVLRAEHGRWIEDEPLGEVEALEQPATCEQAGRPALEDSVALPFTGRLALRGLSFVATAPTEPPSSAMEALAVVPRGALPLVEVSSAPKVDTACEAADRRTIRWTPRLDLLASSGDDPHFVVENDDEGYAHLRFGDGLNGMRPAAGTELCARYRVGNGPAGNVPAEAIAHVLVRGQVPGGVALRVRNPFAATNGAAPEPVDEVRERAPHALHARRERAVIAEDYAEIAGRELRGLERAAAALRWTGSWFEAHVGLDPAHAEAVTPDAIAAAERTLERYRRIGHDLRVEAASYVPLAIDLRICVAPHRLRAEVRAAVLRALVVGPAAFFAPEQLSFGQRIALSALVARVQAVAGVALVEVLRFERQGEGAAGELDRGELVLGPLEIAQLRNDPALPEHGLLTLTLGGGR